MNPADILRALEAGGLCLSASGDPVIVRTKKRLTDVTRTLIRDNKVALPQVLQRKTATGVAPVLVDLADLVVRVGAEWSFTPAEVDKALMHALEEPEVARQCFTALGTDVPVRCANEWDDPIACTLRANRRFDGVCFAAALGAFPDACSYTPDPAIWRRCEGDMPVHSSSDNRCGHEWWSGLVRTTHK